MGFRIFAFDLVSFRHVNRTKCTSKYSGSRSSLLRRRNVTCDEASPVASCLPVNVSSIACSRPASSVWASPAMLQGSTTNGSLSSLEYAGSAAEVMSDRISPRYKAPNLALRAGSESTVCERVLRMAQRASCESCCIM